MFKLSPSVGDIARVTSLGKGGGSKTECYKGRGIGLKTKVVPDTEV